MHDLVIHGARIVDGLGAPARDGSLAVAGGRIAAVSRDPSGRDLGSAAQRVDAGGRVLAPGIVDIHTHYDAQLTWDPFATPSSALGVTTVVWVNGVRTVDEHGALIRECGRPGRLLREFTA